MPRRIDAALAEVARVAQHAHPRVAQRLDGVRRAVGAGVVDDEHLVREPGPLERRRAARAASPRCPPPRCRRAPRPTARADPSGSSLCGRLVLPASMPAAACRICQGSLHLRHRGDGRGAAASRLRAQQPPARRARRPLRVRRLRRRAAARAARRRRPARPLPRDARRRVPERGGGPARDRPAAARPDRPPRAGRPPARRRLRPRPAARRGAPARLRRRRPRALARRGAATRATCSGSTSPRQTLEAAATRDARYDVIVLADVLEHLEDPAAALDALRGAARRRRRAVRGHARPRVGDGARRRRRAGGASSPPTRACSRAARCASC